MGIMVTTNKNTILILDDDVAKYEDLQHGGSLAKIGNSKWSSRHYFIMDVMHICMLIGNFFEYKYFHFFVRIRTIRTKNVAK
jgi:hypothetical protein